MVTICKRSIICENHWTLWWPPVWTSEELDWVWRMVNYQSSKTFYCNTWHLLNPKVLTACFNWSFLQRPSHNEHSQGWATTQPFVHFAGNKFKNPNWRQKKMESKSRQVCKTTVSSRSHSNRTVMILQTSMMMTMQMMLMMTAMTITAWIIVKIQGTRRRDVEDHLACKLCHFQEW